MIYITGKNGAAVYTECSTAYAGGIEVKAADTTGTGDGFIGYLLCHLSKGDIHASDLDGLGEY